MVGRKSLIGPVGFILIVIITIPFFIIFDKKGEDKSRELIISGEIETVVYRLKGVKGSFIYVDSAWFAIIHLSSQEYLRVGDLIQKNNESTCISIVRNNTASKEFCDVIIYKLKNKGIISKINQHLNNKQDSTVRSSL